MNKIEISRSRPVTQWMNITYYGNIGLSLKETQTYSNVDVALQEITSCVAEVASHAHATEYHVGNGRDAWQAYVGVQLRVPLSEQDVFMHRLSGKFHNLDQYAQALDRLFGVRGEITAWSTGQSTEYITEP